MDLSVKPANEIKTRVEQEKDIVEVNQGEKNKADIPLPPPKETTNTDIFDAPVKKTLTRMKKQRDTLAKTKQRLTLKEKRLQLKREKEELKAQRQRIKEAEAEYKRTHPRKPRKKKVTPKVEKKVEFETPKPITKKPKPTPKPRSTPIQKPARVAGIKGLTQEELTTLYGVFAQAQKKHVAENKPKPKPKPTINYINPIEQHAFSHLNNPFNF
jgi:hypothetical protein